MKILTHFAQGSDEWRDKHLGIPTGSEFSRFFSPTAGERFRCTRAISRETCGTDHTRTDTAAKHTKELNLRLRTLDDPYTVEKAPYELADAHRRYAWQLVGERITKGFEDVKDIFDPNIMRGLAHEPRALAAYEFQTGTTVLGGRGRRGNGELPAVGFVLRDDEKAGCSPDGLCYDREDFDPLQPVGCLEGKCPTLGKLLLWREEGVLPAEHKVQVHGHLAITGLPWCDFVGFHASCPDKLFVVRVVPDEFTAALSQALDRFVRLVDELYAAQTGEKT